MTDDFKKGARAAASVASDYDSATTHPYKLGDCILIKLNIDQRNKPRLNKKRTQNPDDAWTCGLVMGIAEMHRRLLGGSDSAGVREVARNSGLTIASAKAAGASSFDWKQLRRAGVPEK
jgi:hypothetical protein